MKNNIINNKYSLGLMYFALSLMLLSSCQSEEPSELKGNFPQDGVVRISTQMNDVQTRAESESYLGSDLSLSIESPKGMYCYTNVKWTESSSLWISESDMLWEGARKTVKIYAYAPYQNNITDIENIPFRVKSDQRSGIISSDLVGYKEESFTPYKDLSVKQDVNITFEHILSKLTLSISLGDQFDGTNISISNVVLLGTNISLDYNAKTMDFTVPTDKVTAAIYMHKVSQNVDPNDNPNVLPDVYSSILVPQTILGGSAMIDVTLSNGAVYRYSAAQSGHLFEK